MQQDYIEVLHGNNPTHAIIWLHGLGADGHDFEPIVPELNLSKEHSVRFIFPHAPVRPVTINGGVEMRAWYDIKGMDLSQKEDLEGMQDSQRILLELINEQIDKGIPSENIIIAGFSQGGAVIQYTGIRTELKLAGMMALSTYLPFQQAAQEQHNPINLDTPIFVGHGQYDPVVPIQLGQQSTEKLQSLGYQPTWHTYPMEHSVSLEEIRDIGNWINTILNK